MKEKEKKLNFFQSQSELESARAGSTQERGEEECGQHKACRTEQGRCLSEHLSRSTERVDRQTTAG